VKTLHPDFGDAFRSDTTLGFMRSLRREDPFAAAQKGPNHDSKKAQKAAAEAAKDVQQEAQPGPNNVAKEAQEAVAKEQEKAQQGPNHDSKKAQKAAAKVAKDNQGKAYQAPNLPEAPQAPKLDGSKVQEAVAKEQEKAQQGPNSDSKKAQKAAAKIAKDNQQEAAAKDQEEAVSDKDPLQAVSDGVAGATKTADKFLDKLTGVGGTKSKQAKKPAASDDKDVSSVSGCTNFPRGWEDSKGNDCEDYDEGHFCDRRGGEDEGWLDEWGTLDSVANKGFSATQACCVCGGGHRAPQVGAVGPSPAAAPLAASPAALQSQGFSGKLVEHVEGKTMTGDWGREFGPKAGHRDVKSICKAHPGNVWCEYHGYYDTKSGACSKSMVAIFAAMVVACLQ